MEDLIAVTGPVFLVIGFGYAARGTGAMTDATVEGLMRFTQKFAIPALLFRAISTLDLGAEFDPRLLAAFYVGAVLSFALGVLGARRLFGRGWEDSIAIGFGALFSNSLLLGLPITERAFGPDALAGNYAIIAIHSPVCYGLGITAMEVARARAAGAGLAGLPPKVLRSMFSNALILGIALGLAFNLLALPQPAMLAEALDLLVRTALPAALFGLGGVLWRYRPEGSLPTVAFVCALSLVLHPAVTFGLGTSFGLSTDALRSAVVTAAMAPGINAYIFADLYGRARRVAATSVLVGTAASLLTALGWLAMLP
ncbi:hypothetical protein BCF33_0307 [Hasllibacter halocynthiae]|uniref:Malonate transporter n=1 Tax=Hasllibacter halocynthiae TaxID=595589 RepID=A0A2T0X6Y1_9RHOB|nr:AEC family transporter [Hasllibacter halocynthiae]PRY94712.1 hypothetical protein BCF33_0307 [Hasllibacter halocynthiae]